MRKLKGGKFKVGDIIYWPAGGTNNHFRIIELFKGWVGAEIVRVGNEQYSFVANLSEARLVNRGLKERLKELKDA